MHLRVCGKIMCENGKGVLYFPDGRQLEGSWTNDKLNGKVIIRSKEGHILEMATYENNEKKKIISDSPIFK